jgi:putative inorganic carbon (hco3(-)) transporter
MNFHKLSQSIIKYGYYLLFAVTPFILTPVNYELFEYNKMMFVYALTAIICCAWIIKMICNKKVLLRRTYLDIPILLFFTSQIISTIFSIDTHVSIFGYYSRFNGGLLSIISYILLYYCFIANFPIKKLKTLLTLIILSGFIVGIYGALEHFGVSLSCLIITGKADVSCWVQDVQNRVFATLGQPNWLGAYLAILIPISVTLGLEKMWKHNSNLQNKNNNKNIQSGKLSISPASIFYFFVSFLFYATLIFTKSRSGFIGFWISNIIYWLIILLILKRKVLITFIFVNLGLLILSFIFGFTYPEGLNKFSLNSITYKLQHESAANSIPQNPTPKPSGDSIIDVGVTESSKIRQIVWKGALDIFKHNPIIGTGVETFAFSYYKYRPVEHNMTSEWDFLYNKAHNEYLNYLATTGLLGTLSYLSIIGVLFIYVIYIFYSTKRVPLNLSNSKPKILQPIEINNNIVIAGLLSGFISILITNFFGFSVVVIQLFFFLIPAFILLVNTPSISQQENNADRSLNGSNASLFQTILICGCIIITGYILNSLRVFWIADTFFATGNHDSKTQNYASAYENLKQAIILNANEPMYYDEFSVTAASLAVAFNLNGESTLSASLKQEAILSSDQAVTITPNNVGFWKNRTRTFYALSQIDDQYISVAAQALEKARDLSPNDPKIVYNLALIDDKMGKENDVIPLLKTATKLKPDFYDAFQALALYQEKAKDIKGAKETYQYILKNLKPNDPDAQKKLNELK